MKKPVFLVTSLLSVSVWANDVALRLGLDEIQASVEAALPAGETLASELVIERVRSNGTARAHQLVLSFEKKALGGGVQACVAYLYPQATVEVRGAQLKKVSLGDCKTL